MDHLRHIPFRRLLDLLVIVALAGGLLWLAWLVAKERSVPPPAPLTTATPAPALSDPTELKLLLPLERIGMVLSRESIPGEAPLAIDHLEQRCRAVLASSEEWVLSLAVSEDEQQLLDAIAGAAALPVEQASLPGQTRLYSLSSPTGRVGTREATGEGALPGRRLLCWGFVLSEGTDEQTVWFARPREQLPRSGSREGHTP